MTSKFEIVRFSMASLIEIYETLTGKTDLTGDEGEFLRFYDVWGKSMIFRIHSGLIRFEPYPDKGAATVHGVFYGNPYKDVKAIKNLLDYYMKMHPEIKRLECHVENRFRGVRKFASKIANFSTLRDGKWVFYYGGS